MNHEKQLSAEEFDRRFEAGEDISAHVDWAAARRPNKQTQRVNVDFPTWMVEALDTEACHLGVSRQALIKGVDSQLPRARCAQRQIRFQSRREDGKSRSNPAFYFVELFYNILFITIMQIYLNLKIKHL